MTVSIPLPAVRMAEPDVLPQPFRMIDEVFCEIVLCAMAKIAEREEHRRQQEAVRPRQVRPAHTLGLYMSRAAIRYLSMARAAFPATLVTRTIAVHSGTCSTEAP